MPNMGYLDQRMFMGWCFTTKAHCHKGGRIVLAWKAGSFTLNIPKVTSQLIHCFIQPLSGAVGFYCSFIYAFKERAQRLELWSDLRSVFTAEPWLLCGDFNSVMSTEERLGALVRESELHDIRVCMLDYGVTDIKCSGNFFTWNNMREGETRVFSKLDRMLANAVWKVLFSSVEVNFQSEGEFDHSPALLTVFPGVVHGKKAFIYFTMWKGATQFDDLIRKGWAENIEVTKMYINLQKLKKIKCSLKELNRNGFSDLQAANIRS